MALKLDPEVEAALAPMMAAMANVPKLAVGDAHGRRAVIPSLLEAMFAALPTPTDVTTKDFYTTTSDGHQLLLRWVTKTSTENPTAPTSAVVYTHGGGEQRILFTPTRPLRYLFSTGLTVMSPLPQNRNDHGRRQRLQASFDGPGLAIRRPAVGRGL